tara:strand:- start:764 stop:1315 length:552 start_codon:yes stop_codon:yes gene_type:complete
VRILKFIILVLLIAQSYLHAQFLLNDYTFTSFVRVEPYVATKASHGVSNELSLNSAESNVVQEVAVLVEQLYIDITTDEITAIDALIYPNPVVASDFVNGTPINLGFYMANAAQIELYIYDMMGQLRLKKYYNLQNDYSGSNAYNFIDINYSDFNGFVSAGAYFYVMVSNDKVVGKGKFGVRP